MKLHFENITISGGIAVGKNTLLDNLKPVLEPLHWKFTSGGKILRDFTKEYIQPVASLADDDFHRKLDDRTLKLLQEGHYVIEAWLAGFMARNMENTLRILLTCSNDALRIDRFANRDNVTIDEAKHYIKEREENNMTEWKRMYGDYDFFSPEYYHLVIDTYSFGPHETAEMVLEKLGYKK